MRGCCDNSCRCQAVWRVTSPDTFKGSSPEDNHVHYFAVRWDSYACVLCGHNCWLVDYSSNYCPPLYKYCLILLNQNDKFFVLVNIHYYIVLNPLMDMYVSPMLTWKEYRCEKFNNWVQVSSVVLLLAKVAEITVHSYFVGQTTWAPFKMAFKP